MAWHGMALNISLKTACHLKYRIPDREILKAFHVRMNYES